MADVRILIVDDELSMRQILKIMLERAGYKTTVASTGEEARRLIQLNLYDLVLTDLNLPGLGGLDLLRFVQARAQKEIPVIIITGYGTTASAVEAMKMGAADYVIKPFDNAELLINVQRVMGVRRLKDENIQLRRELKERHWFGNLLGRSVAIQRVYDMIQQVRDTRINCVLYGESGTGKEMVARAIHYSGVRQEGPFVAVNCGAIPESLIESEMFGYKKGAFTGAFRDKAGYFSAAHKGTLFLDEVADMPPHTQVKVLRAIAERRILPVGSYQEKAVDVRILAASNKDLDKEVREGRFREDLYYRLNVVRIELPPLRDREGDIPILARHFCEDFSDEYTKDLRGISLEAMEVLNSWQWPGNIRELKNVVERAVALESGPEITPQSLPQCMREARIGTAIAIGDPGKDALPAEGVQLDVVLASMERHYFELALERTQGNKTRAASLLGMSFRSFRYRLAKCGLEADG
jgi:two-component system response regulator PilR (NtrC family)